MKALKHLKSIGEKDYLDRVKAITFGVSSYPQDIVDRETEFSCCLYNILCSNDILPPLWHQNFDNTKLESLLQDLTKESEKDVINFIKKENEKFPNFSAMGNFLFLEDKGWDVIEYNSIQIDKIKDIKDDIVLNYLEELPQSKNDLLQKHHLDNYLLKLHMWLGGLEFVIKILFTVNSEMIDCLNEGGMKETYKLASTKLGVDVDRNEDKSPLSQSPSAIELEFWSQQYVLPSTSDEATNSQKDVRLKIIFQSADVKQV